MAAKRPHDCDAGTVVSKRPPSACLTMCLVGMPVVSPPRLYGACIDYDGTRVYTRTRSEIQSYTIHGSNTILARTIDLPGGARPLGAFFGTLFTFNGPTNTLISTLKGEINAYSPRLNCAPLLPQSDPDLTVIAFDEGMTRMLTRSVVATDGKYSLSVWEVRRSGFVRLGSVTVPTTHRVRCDRNITVAVAWCVACPAIMYHWTIDSSGIFSEKQRQPSPHFGRCNGIVRVEVAPDASYIIIAHTSHQLRIYNGRTFEYKGRFSFAHIKGDVRFAISPCSQYVVIAHMASLYLVHVRTKACLWAATSRTRSIGTLHPMWSGNGRVIAAYSLSRLELWRVAEY